MMNPVAKWIARLYLEQKAVSAAISYFETATGERVNNPQILAMEPERIVVRICYGTTRPPHRAYFAVSPGHEIPIRELAWEEAQDLGEKPWW